MHFERNISRDEFIKISKGEQRTLVEKGKFSDGDTIKMIEVENSAPTGRTIDVQVPYAFVSVGLLPTYMCVMIDVCEVHAG